MSTQAVLSNLPMGDPKITYLFLVVLFVLDVSGLNLNEGAFNPHLGVLALKGASSTICGNGSSTGSGLASSIMLGSVISAGCGIELTTGFVLNAGAGLGWNSLSTILLIVSMRSSMGLVIMSVVRISHNILFRSIAVITFSTVYSGAGLDGGGKSIETVHMIGLGWATGILGLGREGTCLCWVVRVPVLGMEGRSFNDRPSLLLCVVAWAVFGTAFSLCILSFQACRVLSFWASILFLYC